jgi:hypothetical protein
MGRGILLISAVFIMLIGPVISEDPLVLAKHSILFGYTDSTNGTGSFSSYNELGSQIKKTGYGSGTIANKMIIRSNQTSYIYQNLSDDYYDIRSAFAVSVGRSMAYKSRYIAIGTGYYAAHPLYFNISLCDKFQIENYASETSMAKTTHYATAIKGTLIAGSTTRHSDKRYDFDSGKVAMKLAEAVINGSSNLKMVHSDTHDNHYDKGTWSIAAIDIDEVYTGNFNLNTNMSLSWPVVSLVSENSWLPCCYGGWKNMSVTSKEGFSKDIKGIFNCTCYNGTVKFI